MADKKIESKQFTLQTRDAVRGLVIAVITAVITVVYASLEAGSLNFDWKLIGTTALTAALAYIMKNWLEPTKSITIHDTGK